LQCVAVCCSVLQCVAVCCSVLKCVAVRCSALQCVAVCCSVLQCVAVCLRKTAPYLVARVRKETCILRHLMYLRHAVQSLNHIILIAHVPPKSPIISGSFGKRDSQLKAFCASSPLIDCAHITHFTRILHICSVCGTCTTNQCCHAYE